MVDSIRIWDQTNAARMSAAMTFYTILSLAPMLMIAVAIAGYMFEGDIVQQQIVDHVREFTDDTTANTVASVIRNATQPRSGLVAGAISIAISLIGASGVFSQLYDTFNDIWHVPLHERSGWLFTIQKRMIGMGLVLLVGVTILAMLVLSSLVTYVNELVDDIYPGAVTWINLIDRGLLYLLMPLVFTAMFWFFPATKVRWRDVLPAGVLTALMVGGSRYFVDGYLRFSSTSEVYGVAGSLVVLLIWIYIIGLCVFYGASFGYAYAHHFGSQRGMPIPRFGAWHEPLPEPAADEVADEQESSVDDAAGQSLGGPSDRDDWQPPDDTPGSNLNSGPADDESTFIASSPQAQPPLVVRRR